MQNKVISNNKKRQGKKLQKYKSQNMNKKHTEVFKIIIIIYSFYNFAYSYFFYTE